MSAGLKVFAAVVYEAPILWDVMLVTDVSRQYGSLIFKGLKVIFGVFFRNEVSMGY